MPSYFYPRHQWFMIWCTKWTFIFLSRRMYEERYDTSNGFGWPVSLKVYKLGDNILFNVRAVINYLLGLENQVKNHGFKFIDKFFVANGE